LDGQAFAGKDAATQEFNEAHKAESGKELKAAVKLEKEAPG
jgi:hypothetical protein